jgi:AraC family transcriptional regulator
MTGSDNYAPRADFAAGLSSQTAPETHCGGDQEPGPTCQPIGTAFATHLIGQYARKSRNQAKRSLSPLAPWRLKRATSFVEANLAKPITLVDLSAVAGLSRMHFAAQFRSATGVSPHTYLLQRRVEAAKQLLLEPQHTIRRVAFAVGFKSEAHFVNVFRRLVGDSPGRWRRSVQQ